MNALRSTLALAVLGACSLAAQAQATAKADGQWRAALGLGASLSSGNSKTSNLSLNGDAVRLSAADKTSLYGNANYAKSAGETTSDLLRAGGRYDYNLNPELFGFGGLDFEHNKSANLSLRSQLSAGLGWHVIKSPATTFDVFGGLGYTSDKYKTAMLIDGGLRSAYSYMGLLLGEESTHKLTDTTSARQKLVVVPNLKNRSEFRATWDAGLAVSMSKAMNLNVGVLITHNSDPGPGRKATDTLLTTGVSVKFD